MVKVCCAGLALLAAAEVFIAKLRLFRVPELLAGSFLLALLAVTAANFFTVGREGDDRRELRHPGRLRRRWAHAHGGAIVWRRDLRAVVRLLAWQGLALAAIPLLRGAHDGESP